MNLVAKGNVKHDGKWYNDGDKISQLKKEDGQRLIDLGVAYESGTEDQEPETPSPLTVGEPDENLSFEELADDDDEDEEDEEEEEEVVKPKRNRNRKKQ